MGKKDKTEDEIYTDGFRDGLRAASWITVVESGARVYVAGCPPRRLETFLETMKTNAHFNLPSKQK